MSFESLGLGQALLGNCARAGYNTPSPIQLQAIPEVMAGRDLLAAAQTGTGKTAAFLLPMLHRMGCAEPVAPSRQARTPRALVLAPTRELAAQIGESARIYGNGLNVRSHLVFGGVSQRPQAEQLARGVDLLIATPGRLLDLHQQGLVDLSRVQQVVLDEADRMLDMGFIRDLKRILKLLPAKRQTLLFSATFSAPIRELAGQFLTNPANIEIAPQVTSAEKVEQHVIRLEKGHKRAMLAWLIGSNRWEQVLVFARTKHGSDRLAKQLTKDGLPAVALHGGKSQGARTRALGGFKDGGTRVLVATDLAARGLDIDQLPCVINFELPNISEDYVHRIGRTGRAGASGLAISLVSNDERDELRDIERLLRKSLPSWDTSGFKPPDPAHERAVDAVLDAEKRAARAASGAGNKRGASRGNGQGARRGGNNGSGAARPGGSKPAGQRSGSGAKPSTGNGARRGNSVAAAVGLGDANGGANAGRQAARKSGARPGGSHRGRGGAGGHGGNGSGQRRNGGGGSR